MRQLAIVGLSFSLGALTALGATWYDAGAYRLPALELSRRVEPAAVPPAGNVANDVPSQTAAGLSAAPVAPAPAEQAVSRPHTGLAMPVDGIDPARLRDTFAETRGGNRPHEALDIMAPRGTPVRAVADGHIEKLFDSAQGGLTIYQFDPPGTLAYYYAHLDSYAPGLREGQPVSTGELLGYVGSTGNASPEAPHLHFAIFELTPEKQWWKGQPINPYPLLK